MVLQGVISQQLIPRKDRPGRAAAIEVMIANSAIRNLMREGKTHQLNSLIQTGAKYGMQTMDSSLVNLYKKGVISYEDAMTYAGDQENIVRYMGM